MYKWQTQVANTTQLISIINISAGVKWFGFIQDSESDHDGTNWQQAKFHNEYISRNKIDSI